MNNEDTTNQRLRSLEAALGQVTRATRANDQALGFARLLVTGQRKRIAELEARADARDAWETGAAKRYRAQQGHLANLLRACHTHTAHSKDTADVAGPETTENYDTGSM